MNFNYKRTILCTAVVLGSFIVGYISNSSIEKISVLEAKNLYLATQLEESNKQLQMQETLKKQLEESYEQIALKEEQRKAINDQLWSSNQKLSACESNTETLENELNKVKTELVREKESQPFAPVINQSTTTESGYIPGTCAALRGLGLSNFTIGDPNYTHARDRDGDGIACE